MHLNTETPIYDDVRDELAVDPQVESMGHDIRVERIIRAYPAKIKLVEAE
jgi:hypothetical protein